MNKDSIENMLGKTDMSIVEAMQKIDLNSHGILFIVDEKQMLIGCLTDGDIRRWIIRTGNLNGSICNVMNSNPKYLFAEDSKKAKAFMEANKISSVAILDSDKRIIDIVFHSEINGISTAQSSNDLQGIPVIVMAGGKGTRLYPFTKILPKPLIPIGDIPILERILNRFRKYGVDNFYITVNYKKEMIKSYFNEINPNYSIHYVEENKPLGTAGSIRLIQEKFDKPIFITNCDILIEADYGKILQHHKNSGNVMTIVSSLKNITIPYGVLHTQQNGEISSMEEKPQVSYFINTGMYVMDAKYIEDIPKDTYFHMTYLAEKLMNQGLKVGMYPISENSFLDMGQFEEMKKMEERVKNGTVE